MADIAMLSILWTICSIPVITMGAASAALMRCVLNMNTEEGNWRSRHFFRYFRSNLKNGTLLWLLFLLAAAVFIFDLVVLSASGSPSARIQRIIAVIGMIIWMITAVWAFALTSQFENGIFQTIKNAFYLGISWLPRTLIMCVLWLVPVALLAFAPFILSRIIFCIFGKVTIRNCFLQSFGDFLSSHGYQIVSFRFQLIVPFLGK